MEFVEEWRDILDSDGRYKVSNTGRIKRMGFYITTKAGKKIPSYKKYFGEKVLSSGTSCKSYPTFEYDGKGRTIHRLVAEAFIDNPDNKPCVNHIDGDRTNNRVDNLEWCTYQENTQHGYDLGLIPRMSGEDSRRVNRSQSEIDFIRLWIDVGYRNIDISRGMGIEASTISRVRTNTTWANNPTTI